jgi:hypothetical protein
VRSPENKPAGSKDHFMGNSTTGTTSEDNKPKKNGAFQISREPLGDQPPPDPAAHKYETTTGDRPPASSASTPAFEDLGELPQSYGADTLFLIARDPHWLFAYWDVNWTAYQPKNGTFYLKLFKAGGAEELTTEIHPEARNWYLPCKEPGASYYVELGYFTSSDAWASIVQSGIADAPQDKFSDSNDAEFATVPIHLTFQRLVDMVKGRMREGESLITALSRLQGEGRRLFFQPGRTPEWTEEQRQVLAALFGQEVIDRISMGSAEIDQLLRQGLLEKLSTESASGLVSKSRLAEILGPMESSLFSAYAAGGLGESFSSGVTSWASGLGSSWSAQPFGQAREFFMHVNAEVIFYGGTHPDAKVWIDGKQITLGADGSFRYHFKFPDGTYSVPIVAESPDGVEQRSASLRFERATARTGEVGHTAQPAHLDSPIGKK